MRKFYKLRLQWAWFRVFWKTYRTARKVSRKRAAARRLLAEADYLEGLSASILGEEVEQ